MRAERDKIHMDDDTAARLLREARNKPDDVDVSEFFGAKFDDLFESLSAEEAKKLERMARNDEVVERTPDVDAEDDELFFDDSDD